MPTIEQWRRMWRALGAGAPDDALFAAVIEHYSESHRRYHNNRHLEECLAGLAQLRPEATHPAEIELALWFHDVIYDPRAHDNEVRSADWARAACREAGLVPDVGDRIHALVLATRHEDRPLTGDAQIIADIDLWILGAPAERFDEYEHQIRQEYSWVPAQFFRRERRRILEGFLERPRLYGTAFFFNTLEAQARQNLHRSIRQLGGSRGQ